MPSDIELPLFFGEKIFENANPSKPLIKGVLWEDDLIMLLGSEKAGKSIIALQMACALTTGNSFLDKYEVPEKVHVLYIQTEGKRHQVIERLNNMTNAVEFDPFYFAHIPKKFLPLDIEEYFKALITSIDSLQDKPKVIIIDALYMAMAGDLIDNQDARNFLSKVAFLMDRYKSAVILVHHESKPMTDSEYKEVDRADKGSYGSVFFRAIVDHIIYLKMNRDKSRSLSCTTQRSGEVMEREDLILVQPSPLCFEIKGDYKAYEEVTKHCIKNNGNEFISIAEICTKSSLSESSVRKAIRHLLSSKVISKSSSKPYLFKSI